MADSPLERPVGPWVFEPFVEGRSTGRGRATFEWIEHGAFLLERSHADWTDPGWVENHPGSTQSVVGFDDTTLDVTQLYADDRGVLRIYRGSVTTTNGGSSGPPRLPPTLPGHVPRRQPDDRGPVGVLPRRACLGSSTSRSPTARPSDHHQGENRDRNHANHRNARRPRREIDL